SFQLVRGRQCAHLHDFYSELVSLLFLMLVHGSNADLHEALHQAGFHDPREWARVRQAIALELIIEVRVSVEMKNRQTGIFLCERFDDRVGDRVVATKRNRALAVAEERAEG